jgi:hypothetical protein
MKSHSCGGHDILESLQELGNIGIYSRWEELIHVSIVSCILPQGSAKWE